MSYKNIATISTNMLLNISRTFQKNYKNDTV